MALAAMRYAAMGWPVCAGAYLPGPGAVASAPAPATGSAAPRRARTRCRRPGSSRRPPTRSRWPGCGRRRPSANVILVTGRVFDVLDVPAQVGTAALARMERARLRPGPVAISAGNRALFFVLTRGAPGRRGRVVVVPPGLRAGDHRGRGRAALAHPGQLRAGAAVPVRQRPGRRAGSAIRPAARCPTACACWKCSPMYSRRLAHDRATDTGITGIRPAHRGPHGPVGGAVRPGLRGHPRRGQLAGPGVRRGRRDAGVHGLGPRPVPDRRGRQPGTSTWSAPGAR